MALTTPADALGTARRPWPRALDWEEWLTLAIAYLAFAGVAWSIQAANWADTMPSLMAMGAGGMAAGFLLARSRLPMLVAWPLGVVLALLSTFLQALFLTGGEGFMGRVDALYLRFERYFDIVLGGGISNDSLPFAVLVAGLTWGGAFIFIWSLLRWQQPWLGLLLGGTTLFVNFVVLDQGVLAAFVLYAISSLLLISRANLMRHLARWRAQGIHYPPLISLGTLHLTLWAAVLLLVVAWIMPTGPVRPLGYLWGLASRPVQSLADDWVRLAGPLQGGKLPTSGDYTSVLPLRGRLGLPAQGELLRVRLPPGTEPQPLVLRGSIYDEYTPGGWRVGPRMEVEVPQELSSLFNPQAVTTVEVELRRGGILGDVIFTPGYPIGVSVPAKARVAEEAMVHVVLTERRRLPETDGERRARAALERAMQQFSPSASDEELRRFLLSQGYLLLETERGPRDRLEEAWLLPADAAIFDIPSLVPDHGLGRGDSYTAMGILPLVPGDRLRQASTDYPDWVRERYLALSGDLPRRVARLARDITSRAQTPYDQAKAIESFLQWFPVDLRARSAPAGRDIVDYFLFEERRGSPELHASAMVVMLRSLGVPARLAVGFVLLPLDYDAELGAYRVEARHTFAWPEVFFPGYGWVPFNPTERLAAAFNPSILGGIGTGFDDFGFLDEGGAAPPPPPQEAAPPPPAEVAGGGSARVAVLWSLVGVALALALMGGGLALAWEAPVARLPHVHKLWEKTVRLASLGGVGPRPGETPLEFGRRLGRRLYQVADAELLARVYSRSRYGGVPPTREEEEELRRLWPHLRSALLGMALERLGSWRRGSR